MLTVCSNSENKLFYRSALPLESKAKLEHVEPPQISPDASQFIQEPQEILEATQVILKHPK